ncbi:proline racemase [Seiridium cupressi]
MAIGRAFNVVGSHCAGEVCDVVVGGVLDVPGSSMFEKRNYFWRNKDHLRNLLMNEPRGSSAMCCSLILPKCNTEADAGFIIMEHEEYTPMSGANKIAISTVLLETGMLPMHEPIAPLKLDTPDSLVSVVAHCQAGKVNSIEYENIPAFLYALDLKINVAGFDAPIKVDIAWGGMWYVLVDTSSLGLVVEPSNGRHLVDLGERIKRAIREQTSPVLPENPDIRGVTNLELTCPLQTDGGQKVVFNTVIVSLERLDRSPCGTGISARLAVLYKRKQRRVAVKGRAWITAFKQVILYPRDSFPEGFRVGDECIEINSTMVSLNW